MFGGKGGKTMDKQIIELYSDGDMARMRGHIRRWGRALCALAAAALGVCVVLTALANTKNAQRMELATVAVSTVAGWIVIYGGVFVVFPVRRELAHAEMLRREDRERVAGSVTLTEERFRIRKSVAVRRVEVREGEQTRRLLVSDSRSKALESASPEVLYTCHGYVAAYEVTA